MAVINDIGDLKDIHPANKQEVGRRLALLALSKTYGKSDIEASGPVFKSMKAEGHSLRLSFDHAEGLKSRDGKPLNWFEVIDADEGGFEPAEARIEGNEVIVSADAVPKPVAVRFAWSMLAEPNLMNGAGLPAGAFRAGDIPKRDLLTMKIREAREYKVIYDLDLTQLSGDPHYSVNSPSQEPIERVAYFVELQDSSGSVQYLWASLPAFTQDQNKLGIPTVKSGAHFQQAVSNLNVLSNVKGIVTGTNLNGGNIEFWPNNYATGNSARVPNASGDVYDFGDQPTDPPEGYGCMQIHNHAAKQTLFAINHWTTGKGADIGIGNQGAGNPDWTFAGNAGSWQKARLRVLVRAK